VTGNAVVREIDNEAETLMTSDQSLQRPNNEAHFGMILDKDVPVPMRGGAILRANVFRPDDSAQFPVLMTFGPYGKDIHLSQFMPEAWEHLNRRHPEILQASSCKHLVFETPDPEMWTPHGYVIVKVDSRGAGKSPGKLDVNSPTEFRDFYDAIEWAGTQPWSSGKVGLLGISYYAAGQWMVAAMRPPHLAALLPWQGTYDFYRDRTRQDGIFASGFLRRWWPRSVLRNQHGNPDTPFIDIQTGERNTGPASLSPAELEENRVDYIRNVLEHPLLDDWYRERIPDLRKIDYPIFVVANWGGLGLHLRGTIDGFTEVASREKWLKIQAGSYFITFLQQRNVDLQRKFFDHYLKNIDNGWESEPKISVELRAPGEKVKRVIIDGQWPLSETKWTRLYLNSVSNSLDSKAPPKSSTSYPALSEGVTFSTAPLQRDVEIAGPVKARLSVESTTEDMDLFVTLRAFDPQDKEITFISAIDPKCPISQGWLRVSHRKLDLERSTEYRPVHTHDKVQLLAPGEIYRVDVEIWATSIALSSGCRLALTIQGKDFERVDEPGPYKGSGFFLHADEIDRPPSRFGGVHTIHTGALDGSYLLLPIIGGADSKGNKGPFGD
jgi:predicted acyl esterase